VLGNLEIWIFVSRCSRCLWTLNHYVLLATVTFFYCVKLRTIKTRAFLSLEVVGKEPSPETGGEEYKVTGSLLFLLFAGMWNYINLRPPLWEGYAEDRG
jgi:hypothetical protein